jgi:AAA+ ATPase superfamily predicted ATPase
VETSKKGIYRIADACYGFWYRFVFPNRPELESGNGDLIAKNILSKDALSTYIGSRWFEDVCRQYLIRRNRSGQLPFEATCLPLILTGISSSARKLTSPHQPCNSRIKPTTWYSFH